MRDEEADLAVRAVAGGADSDVGRARAVAAGLVRGGGLTSHWHGRTVPSSSCSSVSLVGDCQPREMNAYGSRLLEEG
jgi:hypothetical protein